MKFYWGWPVLATCMHLHTRRRILMPAARSLTSSSSDVPLYGSGGKPLEMDVTYTSTPAGFLEATLAAIVRFDTTVITGLLNDRGTSGISANYYRANATQLVETVTKSDLDSAITASKSSTSWISAINVTIEQFFVDTHSASSVTTGGSPVDVFAAIYGPRGSILEASCTALGLAGVLAPTMPMVMSTNNASGELVPHHTYTVHDGDLTHITLRNPWGIVNRDANGQASNGGPNVTDLGQGVFQIPIASLVRQCDRVQYVELR